MNISKSISLKTLILVLALVVLLNENKNHIHSASSFYKYDEIRDNYRKDFTQVFKSSSQILTLENLKKTQCLAKCDKMNTCVLAVLLKLDPIMYRCDLYKKIPLKSTQVITNYSQVFEEQLMYLKNGKLISYLFF